MIEVEREYVYNHGPRLASIFARVFEDKWCDEYDEVIDILGWFTEYYTRSRYPFMLKGRVTSPGEFIDENTAREGLEKALRVLNIAGKNLRERGILQ